MKISHPWWTGLLVLLIAALVTAVWLDQATPFSLASYAVAWGTIMDTAS